MNELIDNTPAGVNLDDLHVTLLGDPNSPIGGILERFQFPDGVGQFSLDPVPQHVPFLDIPLDLEQPRPPALRPTSSWASTTALPTSRRTPATSSPTSTR